MSGEHRYRSAPASREYRENFDRIFRGEWAGPEPVEDGYIYATHPLASGSESREATQEALERSMRHSTLAEAIERAQDGDTIRIFPDGIVILEDCHGSRREKPSL